MAILLSASIIVVSTINSSLRITSPAFVHEGMIPAEYTCEGKNINPEIHINEIPPETKSLVLIMEDPDSKKGVIDHWIMWNIPVQNIISKNSSAGNLGMNSSGQLNYKGPCPPEGTHRYFFKVYALDDMLDVKDGAKKETVEAAMNDKIVASGELVGVYKKNK
ncbi:MAG: YbhB/YbcL family Raf kinase inhibitor-like protein [Bacteroidota bacterium]|nr:YbhB/YbcL family Raf kinase inhibitor-like protein [Bacteroidota bacterium]